LPKHSRTKALLIALLTTVLVAAAITIALLLSTSGHEADGIRIYAGGLHSGFISLLALALPFIFVLMFLILRRALR
jgi:TRAP-type C4-dicarboxylate transport system permease small subunit